MFLHECLTEFLDAQTYAHKTKQEYYRRLMALSRYEDEVNKPVYDFTSQEMFEAFRHGTDSAEVVRSLKYLLKMYFAWLNGFGVDTSFGETSLSKLEFEKLTNLQSKQFFHGLPQLLSRIDADTKLVAHKERRTQSDYRMLSSTFILLWYGLKVPEIVNVKKCDVLKERNALHHNGERFEIHPRAYSILHECANATYYTQPNYYNTSIFYYKESEYLLRTADYESMGENTLRAMISFFNRNLSAKSFPYRASKIYWSGVFYRAYQTEVERGGFSDITDTETSIQFFSQLFSEEYTSIKQMRRRFAEYQEYTSVFRNRAK